MVRPNDLGKTPKEDKVDLLPGNKDDSESDSDFHDSDYNVEDGDDDLFANKEGSHNHC
jgi:hypothetical protein